MAPMRPDSANLEDVKNTIVCAAKRANGTTNGTSVDCKEYGGRGRAVVSAEGGTGTTPTLDVKLQESDDNSTWSDISGATFTQITTSDSTAQIAFDLDSAGRYIRAVATIAGAAGAGFIFCVNLHLPAAPQVPSPS